LPPGNVGGQPTISVGNPSHAYGLRSPTVGGLAAARKLVVRLGVCDWMRGLVGLGLLLRGWGGWRPWGLIGGRTSYR